MDQELEQEMEELLQGHPKNCKCYEPGIGVRCKAKDIGIEWFVQCLDEEPYECAFSVSYARAHYCRCPLRVYIAKKFGK